MRTLIGLLWLTAVVGLGGGAAEAQGPGIELGLGITTGQGLFGNHVTDELLGGGAFSSGWSLVLRWNLPEARGFQVQLDAGYNRFTELPNTWHGSVRRALKDEAWWMGAGGRWPATLPSWRPYLVAGAGLMVGRLGTNSDYHSSEIVDTRWAYGPAVNLGAGIPFRVAGVGTGLEIRVHQGLYEGRGSGWVHISLQIRP